MARSPHRKLEYLSALTSVIDGEGDDESVSLLKAHHHHPHSFLISSRLDRHQSKRLRTLSSFDDEISSQLNRHFTRRRPVLVLVAKRSVMVCGFFTDGSDRPSRSLTYSTILD